MFAWLRSHPVLDGFLAATVAAILLVLLLSVIAATCLWARRIWAGRAAFMARPLPEFSRMQAGALVLDFKEMAATIEDRLTTVEATLADFSHAMREIKDAQSQRE